MAKNRTLSTKSPLSITPTRTEIEQTLIDNFYKQKSLPTFESSDQDNEPNNIHPGTADHELWLAKLAHVVGVKNQELLIQLIKQAASVNTQQDAADAANCAVAAFDEIAPRNGLEAMLAVQMVSTHQAAMDMLRRAMVTNQTLEAANRKLNCATKLQRTFIAQIEALNRLRGKTSEQKVTVKHVHVHSGGQTVVGNVGRGDGHERKK